MKIVRFNGGKTGIVIDGKVLRILDVAASVARSKDSRAATVIREVLPGNGSGSWVSMIESWERVRPCLDSILLMAKENASDVSVVALADATLEAPLPSPQVRIFAMGGNVAGHLIAAMKVMASKTMSEAEILKEKDDGQPPWGYIAQMDTIVGHRAEVGPPPEVRYFDYESECAVILGAGGKDIGPGKAKFWGVTGWNDLSIRDGRLGIGPALHRGALSWVLEKNFDTSNPCGPWIAVDEGLDVSNLRCVTRVNGEERQNWSTRELVYSFSDMVQFLSHYQKLKPGDMFVSGTGTGTALESGLDGGKWLRPGDVVEVEIEGVGILENRVADWRSS